MKIKMGADKAKLTLSKIGQLTYKRPHKGHITMQIRLKNAYEQFTRGELISVQVLLSNIGHNIRLKCDYIYDMYF